ncbi:MAG: protein kinase [Myxococcales bacterium]|nr:protein kinase [Myxococcales bacterium]
MDEGLKSMGGAATVSSEGASSRSGGAGALPTASVGTAPAPGADFELGETLGVGGMGQVLSARQTALDRTVAAKFLRRPDGNPAHLVREAIVTGRLEHPNIVPVHVLAKTTTGETFFSMKRVDGTPWSQALAAGQPLEEALEVLLRVCDAVAFAHARGVLHRDIKPANVLIGAFGEVYLGDWGIAVSLVPDVVLPLAQAASAAGTPSYMAPEMARGDSLALCAGSDVYLLGATLFEVLTGRPPHGGGTPDEALAVAALGEPPTFDRAIPHELAAICRRAMARAPGDRYPGAAELKRALSDYLRHREAFAVFEQAQNRLVHLEHLVVQQDRGLEGSDLGLTTHAAFSECRFGFEQVRRIWPEFEGARQGMQKALRLMAQHEVHHDDARAARILIAQLEAPPRELLAAVEALAALEREARSRELDLLLGTKRTFAIAVGLVILAAAVLATVLFERGLVVPTTGLGVVVFSLPLATAALFSARVGRDRERNEAQRLLVRGLHVNAVAAVLIWTAAWLLDLPPSKALTLYLLCLASNWSLGGVLLYRPGFTIALAMAIAAGGALLVPRFAVLVAGVCGFLGFTALALKQRRQVRR